LGHRGVQPENISLDDARRQSHLGELGLTGEVPPGGFSDRAGAPFFCAAKLHGRDRYGKPADIWAFGVSLFLTLAERPPFPTRTWT
jgi:serine/threonine protein kinase